MCANPLSPPPVKSRIIILNITLQFDLFIHGRSYKNERSGLLNFFHDAYVAGYYGRD